MRHGITRGQITGSCACRFVRCPLLCDFLLSASSVSFRLHLSLLVRLLPSLRFHHSIPIAFCPSIDFGFRYGIGFSFRFSTDIGFRYSIGLTFLLSFGFGLETQPRVSIWP